MFCEDGLFIFFIVFYWQNIAWTFAVLWDETAGKKTVYNLTLTHLSGLSLPVAGFHQNIMSSCSLIHHKWAQWLSTPHNQTPQLTRAHVDVHTAHRTAGHRDPPSPGLGAVDRERKRAGLSRRWKAYPGVYSSSGRRVYTAGNLLLPNKA